MIRAHSDRESPLLAIFFLPWTAGPSRLTLSARALLASSLLRSLKRGPARAILSPPPSPPTFADLLRSFGLNLSTGPAQGLDDTFQRACDRLGVRFASGLGEVWDPVLTLWAFLWQVASKSKSCTAACARALTWRLALGLPPCSTNTGAYCKARQKLPEALLEQLTLDLGERLEQQAPRAWRGRGRRVYLLDGTVVTAADTKANQAAYPQRDHIPEGAGFPLVRCVALLSLATAACAAACFGP